MDRCPPEVLHQIFYKLQVEDVASLRLMGRKYAAVGAEYLVARLRFNASAASLERVKAFVNHPVFSQHIHTLTYEASLLADIKCEHAYAEHFESPHHADEKPACPTTNCSDRELRLYQRNLAKFKNDVSQKYKQYRTMYATQHKLLHQTDSYSETVGSCAQAFPKLEHVVLTNVGRCRHMLSERFVQTFAVSCAVPMEQDTDETVSQLKLMLLPSNKPVLNLKSLTASVLDPAFFVLKNIRPELSQVFKSLKKINLSFRMNRNDRLVQQYEDKSAYVHLSKGGLRDALAAAVDLEELHLAFNDVDYHGPVVSLSHILGDGLIWAKLKTLELECILTDQEYFITTLQRQPDLTSLLLSWTVLQKGRWRDTVVEMRNKLRLNSFFTSGLLEDQDDLHNVDNIDGEAFFEDSIEISLSDRLDMFVTDKDYMNDLDDDFNPFEDFTYDDPEALQADLDIMREEIEEDESHDECDEE